MRRSLGCSVSLALRYSAHLTTALSSPSLWPTEERGIDLRKRQSSGQSSGSSNGTIPAPINIAPSQYWDGNDGPWSSFPIQLGENNQAQSLRVFVSTAGYNTWVIDTAAGCPYGYVSFDPSECSMSRGFLYQNNKSSTYIANSIFGTEIESNLGLNSSGAAGFETVTLGWPGSNGPVVEHSTIFAMADPNFWLGLFGLKPEPTNFTSFNDPQPSFMDQLFTANKIPSRSYGYTAGNQYQLNGMKIFGSLVLGGYDQNRMASTNLSWPFYTDQERDLRVTVQSVSTDKGSPSNLLPSGAIQAFIDSTIAEIWLPEDACSAFESAFGLQWNSTLERYLVSGSLHTQLQNSNPSVTFTLGNGNGTVDIVLPYGAFDLNVSFPIVAANTTNYYFPLKRAANDTQYTLGRTFLQEAYLIADYDRRNFTVAPCAWTVNNVQNAQIKPILNPNITISAVSNSSSSSAISTGAIVGIVIAIVAAIAILGLILFFLRRKKQQKKRTALAELEAKNAGGQNGDKKDSSDTNNEGKPFISAPIGGELGGGEIHELGTQPKPWVQELDSPHKLDPNKAGYSEMDGGGYFEPGKVGAVGGAHEMHGSAPIYEMAGSDVHEMPAGERERDVK